MDRDKANEISAIVNKINRCEGFLSYLEEHSYKDEYEIYYRGDCMFDLEDKARQLLVDYYTKEKQKFEAELNKK